MNIWKRHAPAPDYVRKMSDEEIAQHFRDYLNGRGSHEQAGRKVRDMRSRLYALLIDGLAARRARQTSDLPNLHPEDYCHLCYRPNVVWFAPSELWNKAVRENGQPEILCPVCFVVLAEESGISPTAWKVVPEGYEQTEGQQ